MIHQAFQAMEDEKGLRKIMEFMRLFAIVLMGINIYYYCFGYFKGMGWTPAVALNRNVSSLSFAVPDGHPWTDARLMISVTALTMTGSPGRHPCTLR